MGLFRDTEEYLSQEFLSCNSITSHYESRDNRGRLKKEASVESVSVTHLTARLSEHQTKELMKSEFSGRQGYRLAERMKEGW